MIGLILLAHTPLSSAHLAAAEHIMGKQPHLHAIDFLTTDSVESCRPRLEEAMQQCAECNAIILLTDMLGGSPARLCLQYHQPGQVEVISGLNLPLLMKLLSIRDRSSLADALLHAQEAGRKYINIASQLFSR